jgi:hypothetical protein
MGSTPLICQAMSAKAKMELLLPSQRKNAAERAGSLKHDPLQEFRDSPYKLGDPTSPTYIAMPATAFKGALRNAALDLPGASKAQVGRLTYVRGDMINIYGVPQMIMAVVRCADINRTPDIRTRVIIPEWACRLTVEYVQPLLKSAAVINLLAAAGITQGIGDWRTEKGKGDYGQFKIVAQDDANFQRIIATGGRPAQIDAMETPVYYNDETQELISWFAVETKRRGFEVVA